MAYGTLLIEHHS